MTVLHGDCLAVMPTLDAESVDAIVCDPPYGLSFMGKAWDHGVPGEPFWREALRVAKPGAHLVAFGGTRTFHRLTCAIEDAGWEIRDCLSWLYGSGFPKSLDVSKAIDKAAGAERKVSGSFKNTCSYFPEPCRGHDATGRYSPTVHALPTAPATDAAREWYGWGTALKPAWEPIILARKPLDGTVAKNVSEYGTGALNVDGCRIGQRERERFTDAKYLSSFGGDSQDYKNPRRYERATSPLPPGRWPANVCLDEDAAAMLGEPSRFFYCAKASRKEREAGLDAVAVRAVHRYGAGIGEGIDPSAPAMNRNHHPTVKPLALMRWLCRLVTPRGGLILDPFCGSGSTGCAAVAEGFRFLGIEREAEYVTIAERRIRHWTPEQVDIGVA